MYRTSEVQISDRLPELGPDSLLWRFAGDNRIAFLGGTIGLLQLMHPAIGAGVLEHSNFFDDPSDRVFRSLPEILGAVYDDDAGATGSRVRDFHKTIKGDDDGHGCRYHALDPATFWWAHATFQFMAEQVVDRFDRKVLTDDEREQLYQQGVEWFRRYGVSDRAVPATRAEFQVEWDRICAEELEMNEAVRFVLDMLDAASLPPWHDGAPIPRVVRPLANSWLVRRALSRPSRVVAVGGLPAQLRERLGIRWTRRDQFDLNLIEWLVARTWRLIPASSRWQPRAAAGWLRTTGRLP